MSTGIAVAIPEGMVGLVHPRSGLAARVGLSIVNSPGTIDAGYRGEIKVSLINLDPADARSCQPRRPDRPVAGSACRIARAGRGVVVRRGRSGRHHPWRRRPRFLRRTCESVMAFGKQKKTKDRNDSTDVGPRRPARAGSGPPTAMELDGPFDIEDFDDPTVADRGRLDLGSVLIPMPEAGQVQVELNETGVPSAVWVVTPNGRFTIAAYAAPKTAGLWREVAAELAESLRKDAPKVTIENGPWGREVVGVAPEAGVVRFIGVDGYRWMIRCVVNGARETSRRADRSGARRFGGHRCSPRRYPAAGAHAACRCSCPSRWPPSCGPPRPRPRRATQGQVQPGDTPPPAPSEPEPQPPASPPPGAVRRARRCSSCAVSPAARPAIVAPPAPPGMRRPARPGPRRSGRASPSAATRGGGGHPLDSPPPAGGSDRRSPTTTPIGTASVASSPLVGATYCAASVHRVGQIAATARPTTGSTPSASHGRLDARICAVAGTRPSRRSSSADCRAASAAGARLAASRSTAGSAASTATTCAGVCQRPRGAPPRHPIDTPPTAIGGARAASSSASR